MCAIMYVGKVALEFLPNVELVSFFVIVFTLCFGAEAYIVVTVFNLLEIAQWGLGTWVITYLYVWPLLVTVTLLLKKKIKNEFFGWAIVSGVFGLCFGTFFALFYVPINRIYAFNYWISGLPWDIVHCVANFVIMITLGRPLYKTIMKFGK